MSSQLKVGLLFLATLTGIVVFGFLLGAFQPFLNQNKLVIAYNYAGGLEVGSKVRVMGISVGSVKKIEFAPDFKFNNNEEVKLLVHVSIDQSAWPTIKSDSQFFINLAGVIGEKYLEISPGSSDSEALTPGQTVRGEDPPRIDQLISQSYGLAGKALEFFNKNEGSMVETLETLNKLVVSMNSLMKQVDKTTKNQDVEGLIKDMRTLAANLAYFSSQARSPDGEKTLKLLNSLIHRLEELDSKAIKKFLQEEGIKAKLF